MLHILGGQPKSAAFYLRSISENVSIKPRAIVFTLYGDFLRYAGHGEAKLGALCELLTLFGVDVGTTRVVMMRLKKDGWFETRREGRETSYVLSKKGWRLLDEGRERIFVHPHTLWSGEWSMVSFGFPDTERASRESVRKQLAWLGFGQLTASMWMSPHDRLDSAEAILARTPASTVDLFRSRGRSLTQDRDIAQRCWDLDSLNKDYLNFIESFGSVNYPALTGTNALVQFVRLAGAYRLFPFRDPDLPLELLPQGWFGHGAHQKFNEIYAGLSAEAQRALEGITGVPLREDPNRPQTPVLAVEGY
jgi:phenylacetic acid degradation operon negative regulatory protein